MAVVVGVLFGLGWSVVGGGFGELEESGAARDAERVLRAVDREAQQIAVTAHDWAAWDDTYLFAMGEDESYYDANLGSGTMQSLGLDVMAIVSAAGEPIYVESVDRETADARPFPAELLELAQVVAGTDVAGTAVVGDRAMVLAIEPVVRSDGSGTPAGVLVMGRWLDDALLASLSEQTVAAAALVWLGDRPEVAAALAGGGIESASMDDDWLATYAPLTTLDGASVLAIETTSERAITRKGNAVLVNMAILLGLAGVAFGFVTFALLELGILRRLRFLSNAVHRIGATADINRRVEMGGRDELGQLSDDIDGMLDSLSGAEQRYRRLVTDSAEGILLLTNGGVTFANPAALAMFGADSYQGLQLPPPVEGPGGPGWCELVEGAEPGKARRAQLSIEAVAGERRELEAVAARVGPAEVQVLLRDNTELVRMAEQRRAFEIEMEQAQRLESVGLLAGGIAHDFNNLLTVVTANAELMRDHLRNADGDELLEDLLQSARRAAELTQQLLAYAGKGGYQPQLVCLSGLAAETARMAERVAARSAVVETDLPASLPRVEGDPTQLRQVVFNLALNAIDALPDGRGSVSVSAGSAVLEEPLTSDFLLRPPVLGIPYVYVSVSDSGRGMAAAVKARMFEPFFSTKGTGRGLGLAASFGIVRAAGGAIEVQSEEGRGTTVRVYFPAAHSAAQSETSVEQAAAEAAAAGTTMASLLVVDDDAAVLRVVQTALERSGFAVTACNGGQAALSLFAAGGRWDALLLDLAMPGVDGMAVMDELRSSGNEIPIVVMSGFSTDVITPAHRVQFLQKPFTVADLKRTVASVLESAAA